MMCADHQGAARDMSASATRCWQRAAVEALLAPMGPERAGPWQDGGAGEWVAPGQGRCEWGPNRPANHPTDGDQQ